MSCQSLRSSVQGIQTLFERGCDSTLSDVALLERFLQDRDESAFEALLVRHGPMVWSLARRTVGDDQYSEDVFQADFLVMVTKAHAIRTKASLAAWLFKVTRRLAVQVREELRERRLRELPIGTADRSFVALAQSQDEQIRLIEGELETLPKRFRDPIVLCSLEGLTYIEAANRLDCSEPAIRNRLSRGRELLRSRLAGAESRYPRQALHPRFPRLAQPQVGRQNPPLLQRC